MALLRRPTAAYQLQCSLALLVAPLIKGGRDNPGSCPQELAGCVCVYMYAYIYIYIYMCVSSILNENMVVLSTKAAQQNPITLTYACARAGVLALLLQSWTKHARDHF